MGDVTPLEQFRSDGQRPGVAFGASLDRLNEQMAPSRIQSLRTVILAEKTTLRENGRSAEQAQAWAEGYLAGFDPHAKAWFGQVSRSS